MMKIIAFACLVAVAAGDELYKLSVESNASVAAAQAAVTKADTIAATVNYLGAGLKANQESVTGRYQSSADKVKKIQDDVTSTNTKVENLLKATVAAIESKMKTRKALLMQKLAERAKKTDVATQMKAANVGVANGIGAVNAALAKIKAANAASAKIEASMATCTKNKQVYDAKANKCVPAEASADANMQKVHHVGFENDDGRDCGYLNYRTLEFEKFEEDSYIRVFYYDNLRVHGHTSHAIWNVMVCDEKGNGCAHCNDPGRLNLNKWSGHQHNWWMIDYMAHTLMGLCKRSDNRALKKGTYQFKVMISNNRYDIYTGHNQHSSFTVDEVVKY